MYRGEVWTDGRGLASVSLPRPQHGVDRNLKYELDPSPRSAIARIASQLVDGRFTIATDEPHVKVAWRVTGRRDGEQQAAREKEER